MNTAETVVRESYDFLKPIFEELISGEYVATDSLYESIAEQSLVKDIKNQKCTN